MALPPSRLCELFAGYGGLGLGVRLACGAEPVVYVERGAFAAAVLVARMEDAALARAPLWDDVVAFDGRRWRGLVDCVVGGSPCQDLSVAGKRAGLDGARSGLWRAQLRVLEETGAPFLFWENVGGAIRGALDVVTGDLECLGYRVAACTLRASDVGAPHSRERLFVLAYSEREAVRLESEPVARCGGAPVAPIPLGAVADAHGERESKPQGPVVKERRRAGNGNEAVAHADVVGRLEGAQVSRRRKPVALDGGEGVDSLGREGGDGCALGRARFPPGRDAALWANWRGPQPGVRRSADGTARGLEFAADRLELLGNGVVPQQAAAAFLVCWSRLFPR